MSLEMYCIDLYCIVFLLHYVCYGIEVWDNIWQ